MKNLAFISASGAPCYITEPISRINSQPFFLVPEPKVSQPRLVDLAAAKIRDYIDKGGDWTDLQNLPNHLFQKVAASFPSRSTESQILLFNGQTAFVVERVDEHDLTGTLWSLISRKEGINSSLNSLGYKYIYAQVL